MTAKTWTVIDLILWTTGYFKQKGIQSARLDAELLLAFALDTTRVRLYMESDKPLLESELQAFKALAKERVEGKCVAHIVGKRDFWKSSFLTPPGVFVPRPETEAVVEFAVANTPRSTAGPLLDLCSGSGNLPVSLAIEFPSARVTGVEITPLGAATARQNATLAQVQERVEILQAEAIEYLTHTPDTFAFVSSNPPYVPEAEWPTLDLTIRKNEPKSALTSGVDGLDLLRRLIPAVFRVLMPGAFFAFEYSGPSQTPTLLELMTQAGYQSVAMHRDLAGIDRMITGKRPD